ncbi:MAG TPA: hypothetical protein VK430_13130 [Xanthobacteraceae bacterium]|nr:hypothetical protein [Xanthobacteraceae bacterium]
MQIDAKSAEASLADIDVIVARLKQSSFYRGASTLIIGWGALVAFGYVASSFVPREAGLIWVILNGLGLIATVATGLQYRRKGADFEWRIVIALVLFFALGLVCCRMGHFGWREIDAFWPILFMFGYALAGLWLGRAFTLLGVAIAALCFAGYLWVERWFDFYLAVVDGGGLILAGLWMRRA